jgi:threonine/homoserine/homoserine lactone efflux protein
MKKLVALTGAAGTLLPLAAHAADSDAAAGGFLVVILIAIAIYFLPTMIAVGRGKAQGQAGVFFVNLCLGWSVIGWFVAFIWACSGETRADVAKRDRQHKELLEIVAAKN